VKHPDEILPNHPQVYFASCPAWGLEAIVKITENKLPANNPYQDDCRTGCNFRESALEDMKRRWGIVTRSKEYGDNFGPFEQEALNSIKQGFFPLLSVPSVIEHNWETGDVHVASHIFVTIEEGGELVFLTRGYKMDKVSRTSWKVMCSLHWRWVNSPPLVPPNQLANALFYNAPDKKR
jgi:hypothetical protein